MEGGRGAEGAEEVAGEGAEAMTPWVWGAVRLWERWEGRRVHWWEGVGWGERRVVRVGSCVG